MFRYGNSRWNARSRKYTVRSKISSRNVAAALCLCAVAGACCAHQYSALIDEKRYAEAESAARAKLALDPRNADALLASVELILAQGQSQKVDAAAQMAQQCVRAHPNNSECHEARGNVLDVQRQAEGMFSAALSAHTERDAYLAAVELDPHNYRARMALLQFYLRTPLLLGGGLSRARALANDTGRANPDVSILMQAMCDADDDKLFRAEGLALSVNLWGAEAVLGRQRDLLFSIATQYARDKRYSDSTRVAYALRARFPMSELGYYALGLAAQAQGRHAEALTMFDSALAMAPRATIYYRTGISLMARNDRNGAGAAFRKALTAQAELTAQQRADIQEQLGRMSSQ
jgi:tetratricopeptide (TPR) repeat protein